MARNFVRCKLCCPLCTSPAIKWRSINLRRPLWPAASAYLHTAACRCVCACSCRAVFVQVQQTDEMEGAGGQCSVLKNTHTHTSTSIVCIDHCVHALCVRVLSATRTGPSNRRRRRHPRRKHPSRFTITLCEIFVWRRPRSENHTTACSVVVECGPKRGAATKRQPLRTGAFLRPLAARRQ